jgi:hypothetical protein
VISFSQNFLLKHSMFSHETCALRVRSMTRKTGAVVSAAGATGGREVDVWEAVN